MRDHRRPKVGNDPHLRPWGIYELQASRALAPRAVAADGSNPTVIVAVDDTIHTVTGYYRGRELGEPPAQALLRAFRRVLPPVVYTTIVIALGFAVLGLSSFTFTRNLGLLTAGIMVLCLLADLLLLPALLVKLDNSHKQTAA